MIGQFIASAARRVHPDVKARSARFLVDSADLAVQYLVHYPGVATAPFGEIEFRIGADGFVAGWHEFMTWCGPTIINEWNRRKQTALLGHDLIMMQIHNYVNNTNISYE